MRTRHAAAELVDAAGVVLHAADLDCPHAVVTDPALAPAELAGGALVLVLHPPKQTFTNYHEVVCEWTLWLIAGPRNARGAAWDRLDEALTALAVPLDVDDATPDEFADLQGATYPALVLTLTTTHDIDD